MGNNCKNCDNPLCEMAGKEREMVGYFCYGYEEKPPITNADHIRAMSDEELAAFITSLLDEENNHNVACYGCVNYGTHHSDPANKGTDLYECDDCPNEGMGLDVGKWLKTPFKENEE